MRSIADGLRRDLTERIAQLDPADRIELALRLGEDDLAALAAARGISPAEARKRFARARTVGRVPSRANDAA